MIQNKPGDDPGSLHTYIEIGFHLRKCLKSKMKHLKHVSD